MENLAVSFLVTFMASIAAYYVCKWLDGDKQGNTNLAVSCLP